MASFTCAIPAIFVPGAPFPPLPSLTSQTDLFPNSIHPVSRVSHEELVPIPRSKISKSSRFNPYTKSSRERGPLAWSDSDDEETGRCESSESNDSSSEDDNSNRELIPKPAGEAGRPGRGGYNLEAALNWKSQDFKRIRNHIHYLVEKYLDCSKTVTNQSLATIQIVKKKALKQFPELARYANCWPVLDLIHMRLHYTTGQHAILLRKVSAEMAAAAEATIKKVRPAGVTTIAVKSKPSGTKRKCKAAAA